MRCLYCNQEIEQFSFKSIFLKEDLLCITCRKKLKPIKRMVTIENIQVETFFEYDGMFKNLLVQYKECFDEALYPLFLYDLKEYLEYKYRGYYLCLIPSSKEKIEERGFSHLELMCKDLSFKRIFLETRNDLSQVHKGIKERSLMKNNYFYTGERVKKVLVMDDVVTTGSSMIGAYNALKSHSDTIRYIALSSRK